ncbi:aldose epimerase [Evansella sp. AB-rgal1]|uniref:aldose epimerase family protein n=1 Tax=Evansella sp. AB-rgal1 TaxID=3242696 RepID=UPI00359D8B83
MKIRNYRDKSLEVFELFHEEANTRLVVVPERGGIITELRIAGDELLFINEETLHDRDSNIRGGIPILFPICGGLEDGVYEWEGQTYEMRGHGFARDMPWEVVETNNVNSLSITLRLASNEETKKSYPFEFEIIYTYELKKDELVIHQEYKNLSKEVMPIHAGFHPYFTSISKLVGVDTDSTSYLDYNDGEIKPFYGSVDLDKGKEAVVLLDSRRNYVTFPLPHMEKRVTLEYGKEFSYIVLWSTKGQNYVCIEPWMGLKLEFNKKNELYRLESGKTWKTFMSIKV